MRIGWLSPTGVFTESPFGTHEESAKQICEKKGFVEKYWDWVKTNGDNEINHLMRDFLSEVKGYCLIHNPSGYTGYIVTNMKNLTKPQKEFLYGYFMDKEQNLCFEPCEMESYQTGMVLRKLAEYEDLEEQGKLIKLPCDPGDNLLGLSREDVLVALNNYDQIMKRVEEVVDEIGFLTPAYYALEIGETKFTGNPIDTVHIVAYDMYDDEYDSISGKFPLDFLFEDAEAHKNWYKKKREEAERRRALARERERNESELRELERLKAKYE